MIIDFNRYNGGGGSGSGVTPQEVQRQIDSALTYYWESAITESAITEAVSGLATEQYVQDALSGVSLEGYWDSAQTQDAISAATSGKADAASSIATYGSITGNLVRYNTQGIITGSSELWGLGISINGKSASIATNTNIIGGKLPFIYAPKTSGETGQILTPSGNTPVWITPATINGSAITAGGNIEIQGGGDMSNYWNSAETKSYVDSAATNLQDQIDTMDDVVAAALVDLNDRVYEISASTPTVDLSNYWTSAQTQDAISAATQDMVTSTDVRHIVKLTQAQYDQLATKDPETFYIIVNSN